MATTLSGQTFDFATFHNQLELRGTLTALTALRIGSGRSLHPVGTDLPVVRDALGRPYIPGSSFKGALRAHVERVLRSLLDARGACNPLRDSERCVSPRQWEELRSLHREDDGALSAGLEERLCMACSLFGAPWRASKVQVADLSVLPESWLGRYEVRDGIGLDRDTETARDGLKYDYEVVPASTAFAAHLICLNARNWELGLLGLGLRGFLRGAILLGGATSRGLGRVRLSWDSVGFFQADSPEALIDYLSEAPPATEPPVDEWNAALKAEVRRRSELQA